MGDRLRQLGFSLPELTVSVGIMALVATFLLAAVFTFVHYILPMNRLDQVAYDLDKALAKLVSDMNFRAYTTSRVLYLKHDDPNLNNKLLNFIGYIPPDLDRESDVICTSSFVHDGRYITEVVNNLVPNYPVISMRSCWMVLKPNLVTPLDKPSSSDFVVIRLDRATFKGQPINSEDSQRLSDAIFRDRCRGRYIEDVVTCETKVATLTFTPRMLRRFMSLTVISVGEISSVDWIKALTQEGADNTPKPSSKYFLVRFRLGVNPDVLTDEEKDELDIVMKAIAGKSMERTKKYMTYISRERAIIFKL